MTTNDLRYAISDCLDSQLFGILSTFSGSGPPHSTIVCFTTINNLESIVFVTPKTTRKFENLMTHQEATFFADSRADDQTDINDIWGIEARGSVSIVAGSEENRCRDVLLRRFPELQNFFDAESTATCLLNVETYDVVHRFQDVMQYRPGHPL